MKILTVEEMRQAEQECARIGVSTDILMENAGKAVAEEVRRIFGVIEQKRILFLIGPGNNGGDGMVAARYLHDWGSRIDLYLFGRRLPDDINLKLVRDRGITCVDAAQDENLGWLDGYLSSSSINIGVVGWLSKRHIDEFV